MTIRALLGTKAAELDPCALPDGCQPVFLIDPALLAHLADPLNRPPWSGMTSGIGREEVFTAISEGQLASEPVGAVEQLGLDDPAAARRLHVSRIAWLVANPSPDPIWLELGVPDLGGGILLDFVVSDGNHRLAAAIARNDSVRATFSGAHDRFASLFPGARLDGFLEDAEEHPMFC